MTTFVIGYSPLCHNSAETWIYLLPSRAETWRYLLNLTTMNFNDLLHIFFLIFFSFLTFFWALQFTFCLFFRFTRVFWAFCLRWDEDRERFECSAVDSRCWLSPHRIMEAINIRQPLCWQIPNCQSWNRKRIVERAKYARIQHYGFIGGGGKGKWEIAK